MRFTITLLSLLFLDSAVAADVDLAAQKEIAHLLDYLKQSNCQFGRNGSWFGPDEAVAHINIKYQYLLRKKAIRSADNFIDRAASKSSISGEPYRVACGESAAVESAEWFRGELDVFRKRNE